MTSDSSLLAQQQYDIVSLDLTLDPQAKQFIKTGSVSVTFAQEAGRIATREGDVRYSPGDALISGVEGARRAILKMFGQRDMSLL